MELNVLDIIKMLKLFIEEKDCSLKYANEIEYYLMDTFPHDEDILEYVTDFAMYRPEGGDYLYDKNIMINKCKELLILIESKYIK